MRVCYTGVSVQEVGLYIVQVEAHQIANAMCVCCTGVQEVGVHQIAMQRFCYTGVPVQEVGEAHLQLPPFLRLHQSSRFELQSS